MGYFFNRSSAPASRIALAAVLAWTIVWSPNAFADVDPDGSFSYSIGIELPSAPGRHQPNIGLRYRTNSGDGILGLGWSVTGIPSIQRIDYGSGIRLDASDTFAGPDGRIVLVAPGTYRYSADNGAVITPILAGDPEIKGACYAPSGTACGWKVIDRLGTTFIFGGTEDSRVEAFTAKAQLHAARAIRTWALSSAKDIHGNEFSIGYWRSSNSGDFYPRDIKYAGTAISFNYCDKQSIAECDVRPDAYSTYIDGTFVQSQYLLKRIRILTAAGDTRLYDFEYTRKQHEPSLLSSVRVSSEAQATPAIYRFTWRGGYAGLHDLGAIAVPEGYLEHSNRTVRIHLGDFNGDGRTDLLRTWDNGNHRLFLSNGKGFDDAGAVVVPDTHLEHSNNTVRIHLADFNGDGKTDILRTWDNGNHRLFLSNGKGFEDAGPIAVPDTHLQHSNRTVRIHLGDFNGDGATDLLRTWDDTTKHRLLTAKGPAGDGLEAALVNISARVVGISTVDPSETPPKLRLSAIREPIGKQILVAYRSIASQERALQFMQSCDNAAPGYIPSACGIPYGSPGHTVVAVAESDGRAATGWTEGSTNIDRLILHRFEDRRIYPGDRHQMIDLGFGKAGQYHVVRLNDQYVVRAARTKNFVRTAFIRHPVSNELVRSPLVGQVVSEEVFAGPNSDVAKVSESLVEFANPALFFPLVNQNDVSRALVAKRITRLYEKGVHLGTKTETRSYDGYARLTSQTMCDESSGRSQDCLSTTTKYMSWSPGSTWPADQIDTQRTTSGALIVSGTRFGYVDPTRPVLVRRYELFYCSDARICDDGAGRWVTLRLYERYTASGQILEARDSRGLRSRYRYDVHGNLVEESRLHADKRFNRTYKYDGFSNLLKEEDGNGLIREFKYDGLGRTIESIDAAGQRQVIRHVEIGDPERQSIERATLNTVSSKLIGSQRVESLVRTTYFDGWGREYLQEADSDSLDTAQKLVVRTDWKAVSNGTEVRRSYSHFSGEDPEWVVDTLDLNGRLVEHRRADGSGETYSFERNTRITLRNFRAKDVEPEQLARSVEYFDLNGRVFKRVDAQKAETEYKFDDSGRITAIFLPSDRVTGLRQTVSLGYDSFGRRRWIDDPGAGRHVFEFDLENNLVREVGPSVQHEYEYDLFGRLTVKRSAKKGNPQEISFKLGYDTLYGPTGSAPLGRLTRIEDQSGVRLLAYDRPGNITWSSRKLHGLETQFVEVYEFATSGRLLSYQYPDGSVLAYEYNRRGNIRELSIREGTAWERLATFHLYNEHDRVGRVSLANGVQSDYGYLKNGTLRTARACVPGCALPDQQVILQDFEYRTNRMGMISEIIDRRPASSMKRFRVSGDSFDSDGSRVFGYDSVGRLESASLGSRASAVRLGYVYSEIGGLGRQNTFKEDKLLKTEVLVRDGQRLTSVFNGAEFDPQNLLLRLKSDGSGNVVRKETRGHGGEADYVWEYAYGSERRMVRARKLVQERATLDVDYVYDYLGKRTKKVTSERGVPTRVVWYPSPSFEVHMAEALGKPLTVKHVMVPGIGRLAVIRRLTPDTSALAKSRAAREAKVFAKQRQGFGLGVERTVTGTGPANEAAVIPAIPTLGRFFLHRDHVMSTDLVTDEAGSEWQRIQYGPYGEIVQDRSVARDVIAHRFTGYEWDEETGLYYAHARYYDPQIKQFLSPDPAVTSVLNSDAFNRYAYAQHNPTLFRDPDGQFVIETAIIVGAIIGGTVAAVQSDGDPGAILRGAVIGAAAGGVGAWAGAAAGGGFVGSVAAGAAGGATAGGLSAAFSGANVLEGAARGALYGAAGGAIGGAVGWGGSEIGAPQYLSRAVGAAATCKAFGCSDEQARDQIFISLGSSAVNSLAAPSEGRPLTPGERRMLAKSPDLKGIDLDAIRIHRGGIYTWWDDAVTLDNNVTFPGSGYSSDFSIQGDIKWFAHEVFHVYEYQTSSYHWTDAMVEQIRYRDPYSVQGTHERRADEFADRFRP